MSVIDPEIGGRIAILLTSAVHLYGQAITGGAYSIFAAWMMPAVQVRSRNFDAHVALNVLWLYAVLS
jgi:hypothetical protein